MRMVRGLWGDSSFPTFIFGLFLQSRPSPFLETQGKILPRYRRETMVQPVTGRGPGPTRLNPRKYYIMHIINDERGRDIVISITIGAGTLAWAWCEGCPATRAKECYYCSNNPKQLALAPHAEMRGHKIFAECMLTV